MTEYTFEVYYVVLHAEVKLLHNFVIHLKKTCIATIPGLAFLTSSFSKWLVAWLIRATILTDPEQACRSGVLTFPWVPKRSPCFWSAPQFTGVRGGQAAGLFRRSSVSISLFLSVHIFVNYMLHPEPTALFGLTNLIVERYILNQAWHNQLVLVQPWNIFIREKNPALVHPK